ncbi:hypothetical protein [Celeribacter sp.]|uniref:hypothetical protein n=1 Tax=Celeribacter sp. TaxID=1890673 RepID=UPI003A92C86C
MRLLIWPPARTFVERHPRSAPLLADRLHPERGFLLTASVALDQRIANLAHTFWTPSGLARDTWITQIDHCVTSAPMGQFMAI